MPESGQTESDTDEVDRERKKVFHSGRWFSLSAGILLLTLIVLTFIQNSGRIKFFTENLLNLLILVVIAVQAYIYSRQWKVMEQQWIAMRRGLVISMKGVEVAERSLILGSRAYVGINFIRADLLNSKRILVKLGNTGKLPAEDVKVFVELLALLYPGWGDSDKLNRFTRRTFSFNYGHTTLFPIAFTIDFGISLKDYLSDEALQLISKDEGMLIIRGYAEYGDGFETAQRSHFALRYVPGDDLWTPYPIDSDENPLDGLIAEETNKQADQQTHLNDPL